MNKIPITVPKHPYKTQQPIHIEVIEEKYGAKFIGDFCIKTQRNGWTDFPVAIFYQPNPIYELGHTHYFGIFVNPQNQIVITNGESAFSEPIAGLITEDGSVIYSRYRHDFVTSNDGSLSIDGGRDYCKVSGHELADRLCQLVIDRDKLVVLPSSIKEPIFEKYDLDLIPRLVTQ